MLEYPFRSNLNCLVIVLRCIGRGCCLFNSYYNLSTTIITSDHYLSDSDWIRTNDPQLRRLLLYPAELRNQLTLSSLKVFYLIFMPYGCLIYFQVYQVVNLMFDICLEQLFHALCFVHQLLSRLFDEFHQFLCYVFLP